MFELDPVAPDSLRRFVLRWYGLPDRSSSENEVPAGMPAALVEWHDLQARRSVPLCRDHEMVYDVGPDMVTFWRSETDAYGFQPATEEVFEWSDQGWTGTGHPLGRFLVYVAVFEAVYAPVHGLVALEPAPELKSMLPLEDPIWQWPDPVCRFYADDDLLAHAGPDRLVVAAQHRDALGRFDPYGLTWLWDSRVDVDQ